MANSVEVTEKTVNGNSHATAITKSYNTSYIKRFQAVDAAGTDDTEVFLRGRATKDLRRVDEAYATVLLNANAIPTATNVTALTLTVKAVDGKDVPVAYTQAFGKVNVVEFFADPNDATDSIVVTTEGKNDQERSVWTVDETYAAIKTLFN